MDDSIKLLLSGFGKEQSMNATAKQCYFLCKKHDNNAADDDCDDNPNNQFINKKFKKSNDIERIEHEDDEYNNEKQDNLNLEWQDVVIKYENDWRDTTQFTHYNYNNSKKVLDDHDHQIVVPDTKANSVRTQYNDFIYETFLAARERNSFIGDKLNAKQRLIYQAILDICERKKTSCGHIILIQAPPGTGKTHTLLTAAHYLIAKQNLPHIVIFKNDLINKYRHCASGFSFAQFSIYCFDMQNLSEYKAVESILNRSSSVECVINMILQITRQFRLKDSKNRIDLRGNVTFFDEYTVICKPLLYSLLLSVKLANLRLVFCGDRDQLGCIRNSHHTRQVSSFDIIHSFADETFTLNEFVRCTDQEFNEKTSLIGRLSSDEKLGIRGNALVAAIFLCNLLNPISPNDTLIMRNHKSLSRAMYIESMKYNYAYSFWILKRNNNEVKGVHLNDDRYLPIPTYNYLKTIHEAKTLSDNATDQEKKRISKALDLYVPGKYLPFLILNIGAVYYYNILSDSSLCILRKIYFNEESKKPECIEVEMVDANLTPVGETKLLYNYVNCNKVVFSQHLNYLTNEGDDNYYGNGVLINFPIYPKFYMTVYMSQGCTINTRISFNTEDCTYKCLYVMMSRVNSPKNINSVLIEHTVAHLISILMNFDVVTYNNNIPVSEIEDKILCGVYKFYFIGNNGGNRMATLIGLIRVILDETQTQQTRYYYLQIFQETIKNAKIPVKMQLPLNNYRRFYNNDRNIREQSPSPRANVSATLSQNTLRFMLKYKKIMLGLVRLPQIEASIWLRAFLQQINITAQLANYNIFSNNDEYDTKYFKFKALFENSNDYKSLEGIDMSTLRDNESKLFVQAVRRLNDVYWKTVEKESSNFSSQSDNVLNMPANAAKSIFGVSSFENDSSGQELRRWKSEDIKKTFEDAKNLVELLKYRIRVLEKKSL